jgi:quinol monooxygenase YgiN
MVIATLNLTPATGQWRAVVEVLKFLQSSTWTESGCLGCHLYQQVDNPHALRYVEEWIDEEALGRRLRSTQYGHLLEVMEASVQPPLLTFRFVNESRGLEYVEAVRFGCGNADAVKKGESTDERRPR